MAQLNEGLGQLQLAMAELGASGPVTTLTASDFGCTFFVERQWFTPRGHHFIIGGAARGGRCYGKVPRVSLTSDGSGRAGTFAAVPGGQRVLPSIGSFANPNLGFMR